MENHDTIFGIKHPTALMNRLILLLFYSNTKMPSPLLNSSKMFSHHLSAQLLRWTVRLGIMENKLFYSLHLTSRQATLLLVLVLLLFQLQMDTTNLSLLMPELICLGCL